MELAILLSIVAIASITSVDLNKSSQPTTCWIEGRRGIEYPTSCYRPPSNAKEINLEQKKKEN